MKRTGKGIRIGAAMLVTGMLLAATGCGRQGDFAKSSTGEEKTRVEESSKTAQAGTQTESETQQLREVQYSVWNAYWNLEGVEEQTEELADHIQNVNFFAAYFDKDDKVFIPDATKEFYDANSALYRQKGWNCYLTVVNDQILADGSSSLKSTELLYRLLETEEAYQAHAEELIALVKESGYEGLEIDYENIRKDTVLWDYFMQFTKYLYDRCTQENILLRIVIESNIDTQSISWVEGPVYCVMCYNLYGTHSGPGPKADKEFLEEIMEKMRSVPGEVDYALANGGFDWDENGGIASLTTEQAEAEAVQYQAEVIRDEASGVNHFEYEDENQDCHEVWYGDNETLQIWMGWLQSGDNWNYSIWRLGK